MTITLYFLSLILAVTAINIWSKDDTESADGQLGLTLLNVSAAGSGLVLLVLFGGGFVLLRWFIPLIALVVGLLVGTAGAMLARKGGSATGFGVVCGLASVSLAASVAYILMQG